MKTPQPHVQKARQQSSVALLNHASACWRLGLLLNAQRGCREIKSEQVELSLAIQYQRQSEDCSGPESSERSSLRQAWRSSAVIRIGNTSVVLNWKKLGDMMVFSSIFDWRGGHWAVRPRTVLCWPPSVLLLRYPAFTYMGTQLVGSYVSAFVVSILEYAQEGFSAPRLRQRGRRCGGAFRRDGDL